MKKDGKYRFSLQFGSDSEEQIRAGELLERLGNKKSNVIIAAINEYISNHPEVQAGNCKIEVQLTSSYSRNKIEEIIKRILDEKLSSMRLSDEPLNKNSEYDKAVTESEISQMLDNLSMFE